MSDSIRSGPNISPALITKIIALPAAAIVTRRAETRARGSGEWPVGREIERGLAAFGEGPPTNQLIATAHFACEIATQSCTHTSGR